MLTHPPDAALFDAVIALRALLKAHLRLLMSLPSARTDVGPGERDGSGRLFRLYEPEELQPLLKRLSFRLIGRWDTENSLQRAGTRWFSQLFELGAGSTARATDQIDGFLNRDRTVATYKLALLRALAEIATQKPGAATWRPGGRVAAVQRIRSCALPRSTPECGRSMPKVGATLVERRGSPLTSRAKKV